MTTEPTTIQAVAGRLFKLQLASGASPTTFSDVTGLRATDVTLNGQPIDITTKTSGGWREYLPGAGVSEMSFTGSGVYDTAGVNLKALPAAIINSPNSPVYIQAKITSAAGDAFVATFAVMTFKRSGAHDGSELFDLTLNSSGPVLYLPNG